MQKNSDIVALFNKAISNDNPTTKLWKYRAFILTNPAEAATLKQKMLELALKHKLIGEYEYIYIMNGTQVINIPRVGLYHELKVEFQTMANKLKVQASQYEQDKVEEEIRTYFKLAELSALYGDHIESDVYYSKILRRQSGAMIIRDQQYFYKWGRELFYMIDDPQNKHSDKKSYEDLEFFSVRSFEDEKKINSTLAFVRDVYRLSRKGRGKGRIKVLEHLLAPHFTTQDLLSNNIFNLNDLGFLYSLLALAFKDRASIKKHVKWSSKVETSFLQSDYKKLFSELQKNYENFGQFNPTISFVFQECMQTIRNRVYQEIFNAYQSIPLKKVSELTGYRTIEIELFVKDNPDLPYLFDPITQSVVYYQKSIPLFEQANTFMAMIRDKFENKEKSVIDGSKDEFELDDFDGRGRSRGIGPIMGLLSRF